LRAAGSLKLKVSIQGTSISGAVCQIAGSPFLAVSDLEGHCTLTGLPPGVYHVSVNVEGLPQGTTGPIAVVSLQVTPAGTLNLVWVAPGPPLTPPVLTAPAHNGEARDIATLSWNAVAAATSYDVQASTDSSFSTLIVNDTARVGLSRAFTVTNGAVYHWRVRARNSISLSNWSPVRRFTGKSTPLDCIIAASEAPVLISPAHLAKLANPVALSWGATCGAAGYRVQVGKDSAFNSLAYQNDSVSALTVSVALSGSFTYHWRVSAKLSTGAWAAWSPARIFQTDSSAALAKPVLVSPANGASGLSTVTLSWSSTVSGANAYVVQVATDSMFNNLVRADTQTTMTLSTVATRTYTNLDFSKTYYWRVFALGSNGTSVSEKRRFTTAPFVDVVLLSPPLLTAPADSAMNLARVPTFSWGAVTGAAYYHIQVSTVSSFATVAFSDSMVTGTSKTGYTLNTGTRYYWRVRAKSSSTETGAWSTVRMLLTEYPVDTPNEAPWLMSPADSTTNSNVVPVFAWAPVSGAAYYHLQIARTANFTSLVFSDSAFTGFSKTGITLLSNTRYYWRVRAKYDLTQASAGPWSPAYTLTTEGSTPAPSSDWDTRASGTTVGLYAVASRPSDSLVVAVGDGGAILTSLDKNTWTARSSPVAARLNGVTWGANQFVAVGNGGIVLTSSNGTTWTARTTGVTANLYSVIRDSAYFVAVGAGGTILYSLDGSTWQAQASGTTNALYFITSGAGKLVVGGANGTLRTSSASTIPGASWTGVASSTTNGLHAGAWSGTQLVVVGAAGVIISSANASTWTQRASGTSQSLNGISGSGGSFKAVGANGVILASVNGTTWTSETSPATSALYAITRVKSQWVAVGIGGTIVTSY
jgi:hypothetical protein